MTVTLAKQIAGLALIQTVALGQGGISLAGSDYSSPSALLVAPGQIITLRAVGLKTVLPANAPVRATSVPLPKSLAGISVVLTQTGPALTEQLPLFAVQQFNQCGGADSNAQSPECIVTALTVQVPFDIAAVAVLDLGTGAILSSPGQTTAISILEAGGSSKSFAVQAIPFNAHILTSCDLVHGGSAPPPPPTTAGFSLPGSCQPIVTHADGSPITYANQAKVNEILVMYAVGLGVTVPPGVTGEASKLQPPLRPPALNASGDVISYFTHGRLPGIETGTYFSGLVPGLVGVYQLNFQVVQPLYYQSMDCSIAGGPYVTFGIESSTTAFVSTNTATLCVDTKPADALPFSSVAPMATNIPEALRDAFGPGLRRMDR
jgi:uncharacterized protein (TIGR03437 family)